MNYRKRSHIHCIHSSAQRKKISRELGTLAVPHSDIARSEDGDVGQVGRRWRRGTERASCCLTGSRESEARLYVGVTLPYAYLHRLAPSFATSPPATACLEVSSRLKDIIVRLFFFSFKQTANLRASQRTGKGEAVSFRQDASLWS
ncbi:hypothetical protein ALC56_01577 [Trachymyrmex septentrionalis]|uniref:Uncharacterized protein n=1 Tax=Trachymyrmex septentrionalis TaxID=34720 RepID=A0A195FUA4_9HYME|nr:hypothetical protein ALC56_01577 [Trachymyrmex septentrionalis]